MRVGVGADAPGLRMVGDRMRSQLRALAPCRFHVTCGLLTVAVLGTEALTRDLVVQAVLGAATWAALIASARGLPGRERLLVWCCVVVATGVELFASVIWGLYRYRFHNLPLFVPPGHGLIMVFGLTAARTPLLQRHGRALAHAVLAIGTCWAIAGLTVLPAVTGRFDVHGALYLPWLAWFLLRSRLYREWLAVIVCTTGLELVGALFGSWAWAVTAPATGIPSGNPPSLIGAGYCWINVYSLGLAWLIGWAWTRVRRPASDSAVALEETAAA